MSKLPKHIRDDISRLVLKRAVEVGWEDLPNKRKSELYEDWAADPKIGSRLAEYIPTERIRVWIKDGPMKEYKRARRGLGPYADLVPEGKRYEELICQKVLGSGYRLLQSSIDVKPNRFDAECEHELITVIWGNVIDLKHMVWAWLNHPYEQFAVLVLLNSRTEPLTSTVRSRTDGIAKRLGTEIVYLSIQK